MARSKKSQAAIADALAAPMANAQVGLGVDIVQIERMGRILQRTPSFARRVFSEAEQAYCDSKAQPAVHYACRFAAKEAVVKALGTGFGEGIGVRDIEVRRTSKGRPYVVLTGRAREVARSQGVREIPISLSFTHDEAVACAMAITEDAVAASKKRVDPTEQLTRQFKEARSMLDDLGKDGDAVRSSGAAQPVDDAAQPADAAAQMAEDAAERAYDTPPVASAHTHASQPVQGSLL